MIRLSSPIFHSCGCGAGNGNNAGNGNDAPTAGNSAALICDNRYLGLQSLTRVRLLGVPLGGNCQQYLKAATEGGRGFAFMGTDGQIYVEDRPALTLPYLNPAVSGVFPPDGNFAALMIANGADPMQWLFLRAPTTGSKVLAAENGVFLLKDPASSSGSTAVCYQDGNVASGNIVVCVKTGVDGNGFPTYGLSKLTVLHKHPVEGYIDPGTGIAGYRAIPSDQALTHPLAKIDTMRHSKFFQFDIATGNDEAGGMAPQPQTGGGAINDAELCVYSPSSNKFYRLPARTKETLTVTTDVVVADNGSYGSMGGHCLWNNLQFNFPDYLFTATVRIRAGGGGPSYDTVLLGLFIDGTIVNEWDTKNGQDIALSYVGKGLTVGQHTVELKFKQNTDVNSVMTVKFSTGTISTLL